MFEVQGEQIDLRLQTDQKDDVIDLAKMRFANLAPTRGLKIFGLPDSSLKNLKQTNRKSNLYDHTPDDQFWLKDESIQTQE